MSELEAQPTMQATDDTSNKRYVVHFTELGSASLALVGGKGSNLGELMRAKFPVPPGFCVTTTAYARVAENARLEPILAALEKPADLTPDMMATFALQARNAVLAAEVPSEIAQAITDAYASLGSEAVPVAVRSSATAEDLADASFAGQQDTLLNVVGADAALDAVRRCWASLWTDRAVAYRAANGVDQHTVRLSAVVQTMVAADVSGVLFTADPLSGKRDLAAIDATPGLGEALVSGAVNPDHFVVNTATLEIVERRVGEKQMAIRAIPGGGTEQVARASNPGQEKSLSLTDALVLDIADLGIRVQRHYRAPQDIEWAIDTAGQLWLLQARPITTLYPLPDRIPGDRADHIYVSANVLQGVFQPLTPMGVDIFRRIGTGGATLAGFRTDPSVGPSALAVAAGRIFIDVAPVVNTRLGRRIVLGVLGIMEARTSSSLRALLDRPEAAQPHQAKPILAARRFAGIFWRAQLPRYTLRAVLRPEYARRRTAQEIEGRLAAATPKEPTPGEALVLAARLIESVPAQMVVPLIPSALLVGNGMLAVARRLARPLGVESDVLLVTRGLPHNVTTEMNLALWDLSRRLSSNDQMRELLAIETPAQLAARYLRIGLPSVAQEDVARFLARYGFRAVAEIDIGVPRWSEDPTHIFGMLANYAQLDQNDTAPDVQFARSARDAQEAVDRVIARARMDGLGGRLRATVLHVFIRRVRELGGTRESPKYYAVMAMSRARSLLWRVGETLAARQRVTSADDVFFLTLDEARAALDGADSRDLVRQRRDAYTRERRRKRIPRVLLADGTALYGDPQVTSSDSANSLTGSAASPGVFTGAARVILDPIGAHLEPGEVLVAPSTDPGWTPLFMTAGALVMEMGGMMSHGAVVAREYGIPAVVGAPDATTRIHTGETITVDGMRGIVQIGVPTG
jgi:pyruvate,water dikinase